MHLVRHVQIPDQLDDRGMMADKVMQFDADWTLAGQQPLQRAQFLRHSVAKVRELLANYDAAAAGAITSRPQHDHPQSVCPMPRGRSLDLSLNTTTFSMADHDHRSVAPPPTIPPARQIKPTAGSGQRISLHMRLDQLLVTGMQSLQQHRVARPQMNRRTTE
jgi:hypothetical protein